MHSRLRLPIFTHVFQRGEACALYSSLNLRPVFIDPAQLPFVHQFESGQDVEDVLGQIPEPERPQMEALLETLAREKILVNAQATDEEILRWFQETHTGHPYVSIAYFILTDACNFGCKYCFVETRMGEGRVRQLMSPQTVSQGLAFFERLIRLKPEFLQEEKTIVIYGGEPLLNPRGLETLLQEIEVHKRDGRLPQKTTISLVTNATHVTSELAELLARQEVNVAVSIDGSSEATDEARRFKDGSPVSEQVLRGFAMLKDAGVNVGISCTLGVRSLQNFDETIEAIRRLGVNSLGFNLLLSSRDYPVPADYDETASRHLGATTRGACLSLLLHAPF